MATNEIFYNTKYGEVGVAVAPAEGGELANAGTMCHLSTVKIFTDKSDDTVSCSIRDDGSIDPSTTKDCEKTVDVKSIPNNSFGIKLKADGTIDTLKSDLTANTAEIDDDPTNTYGLASKKYLYQTVLNHSEDPDAHSEIFSDIISKFTDLYEQKGEFRVNQITDTYGNIIYANGRIITNGNSDNAKYVVVSAKRLQDFDALEARVKALEDKINEMESAK